MPLERSCVPQLRPDRAKQINKHWEKNETESYMVLKARSDGFNLLSKPGTISMPSKKLSGLGKQQKKTGKKEGGTRTMNN